MTKLNSRPSSSLSSTADKFLSFFISDEEYGLEILKVREIIGLTGITPLPKTPAHVRGVINLRGRIIPVIDLRTQFGMGITKETEETCIIVVDVELEGREQSLQLGCVVDRVSEVLSIPSDAIEAAPEFGTRVGSEFILGLGKVKDSVLILLNIDKVLQCSELEELSRRCESDSTRAE